MYWNIVCVETSYILKWKCLEFIHCLFSFKHFHMFYWSTWCNPPGHLLRAVLLQSVTRVRKLTPISSTFLVSSCRPCSQSGRRGTVKTSTFIPTYQPENFGSNGWFRIGPDILNLYPPAKSLRITLITAPSHKPIHNLFLYDPSHKNRLLLSLLLGGFDNNKFVLLPKQGLYTWLL